MRDTDKAVDWLLTAFCSDMETLDGIGPRLTCGETDALALALAYGGNADGAAKLIDSHADYDDKGDLHYAVNGPNGQPAAEEYVRALIAGEPHEARPDDNPEPGDRCKYCDQPITWEGPSLITDWLHVD